MDAKKYREQAGIILVTVLLFLTLFSIGGIIFVSYSTAARQCEQNPTVTRTDDGCTKVVGNSNR